MRRLVYPLLFLGLVSVAAGPSLAELRTMSPSKFPNTVDFDNMQSGISLDDQYQNKGIIFRDKLGTWSEANGTAPGTVMSNAGQASTNALEPMDARNGVYIMFENPVRTVGAQVKCDSKEGTILLEAYDASGKILGGMSLGALNDAWQFIGFKSSLDVAAVRFYRLGDKSAAAGTFELDDFGFSANTAGLSKL